MKRNVIDWVYETLVVGLEKEYQMPGVEHAFEEGSFCMNHYSNMLDAYARLRKRLGVVDEDKDVEEIIFAFMQIEKELCYQMYRYGAQFGVGEEK